MDLVELSGFIGGLLTTGGFVPQVWHLFKLKNAHEISLIFTSLFDIVYTIANVATRVGQINKACDLKATYGQSPACMLLQQSDLRPVP